MSRGYVSLRSVLHEWVKGGGRNAFNCRLRYDDIDFSVKEMRLSAQAFLPPRAKVFHSWEAVGMHPEALVGETWAILHEQAKCGSRTSRHVSTRPTVLDSNCQ